MVDARPRILTPDQRLRVFVSSTLQELAPERAAARTAIESLQLIPVLFELGARPHPPQALYRAYLEQSQLFVGVYWQSYGWTAPGESVSGIEDEYRLSAGLPRLLYVREPAGEREPALDALLERFRADASCSYREFETADELEELIRHDLALVIAERFQLADVAQARYLPAPDTPLVGRRAELDESATLLRSGRARLITLTGPGGIGKTRLALQLGHDLADAFSDGVYFVDLANLPEAALVPSAIARALGIEDQRDRPPSETVPTHLHARHTLLVLDNFEVVDDAAPFVSELLRAAPELAVLVTSRTPLRLTGEHELRVQPLLLGDAVQLFAARACAVAPGFRRPSEDSAEVVELCRRLDCLPLAIELAAARTREYATAELLEQVPSSLELASGGGRDLPDRQRTLRATIEWSCRALTSDERSAFARLGVFAGGFTFAASEQVCGAARATISSLVAKSLLHERPGPDGSVRCFMLETVREYALELLRAKGDAEATLRCHAGYFVRLAEEASLEPLAEQPRSAWRRLDAEQDNLRAALVWSHERGAVELELRLVGALAYYWTVRGSFAEGRERIEAALAHSASAPAPLRAKVLAEGARAAHSLGDYERMAALSEESLELYRTLGDGHGTVLALNGLAVALRNLGDFDHGIALQEEAAGIAREIGDEQRLAAALNNLGYALIARGAYARAREYCEEALELCRRIGHATGVSVLLGNLGLVALFEKRANDALAIFRESLAHDRELGYAEGLIYGLSGTTAALAASGRQSDAAMLLGAARAAAELTAVELESVERSIQEQTETTLRDLLGEDAFAAACASGAQLTLDEAAAFALDATARVANGRFRPALDEAAASAPRVRKRSRQPHRP